MGQQHHVLMLSTAGRSILPGKIAALADAKNLAETLDGEFLLRRIDETEPHRLPSLAKKVAALFRISRSCRKISFSRRNRFSSAARFLLPFGRRRLDLVLTALVEPAPQRRKADAEVHGDLPLRPTTHLNQPNGFGFKFLPEPLRPACINWGWAPSRAGKRRRVSGRTSSPQWLSGDDPEGLDDSSRRAGRGRSRSNAGRICHWRRGRDHRSALEQPHCKGATLNHFTRICTA